MISPDFYDAEYSFLQAMNDTGIAPPSEGIHADGQIHRYHIDGDSHGSKNGSYQLWPDGLNHDGRPNGWFMDYKRGGEKEKWQFYSRDNPSPKERPITEERAAARARREAEQRQEIERRNEVFKEAWRVYSSARSIEESDEHSYLQVKHVTPRGGFPFGGQWCGLRVGGMKSQNGKPLTNLLFIPMMDVMTGKFCGLHRVFGRPGADGKFGKGWCSSAGGVFPIGVDVPRGVAFVGEGIATILSWYQYWSEESGNAEPCTAIAAMDAGNLIRNAAAIRARYRGRDVFVLQDDDAAGEKAAAACMAAGFTGVINPRDYIR